MKHSSLKSASLVFWIMAGGALFAVARPSEAGLTFGSLWNVANSGAVVSGPGNYPDPYFFSEDFNQNFNGPPATVTNSPSIPGDPILFSSASASAVTDFVTFLCLEASASSSADLRSTTAEFASVGDQGYSDLTFTVTSAITADLKLETTGFATPAAMGSSQADAYAQLFDQNSSLYWSATSNAWGGEPYSSIGGLTTRIRLSPGTYTLSANASSVAWVYTGDFYSQSAHALAKLENIAIAPAPEPASLGVWLVAAACLGLGGGAVQGAAQIAFERRS